MIKNHKFQSLSWLFLGLGLFLFNPVSINKLFASPISHRESFSILVNPDTEINVEHFPASGETIFIWQPHERGIQSIDRQLASQLANNNIDVWLVDLLEAYFLPNTASNMDRLSGEGFQQLINTAISKNKTVVVGSSGRGAIPVLRGVRDWQLQSKDQSHFAGLILLSPKLFVKTPQPGTAAEFMPIVEASDLPVYLLQPNKSPWFWKLKQTIEALQTSGSDVYIKPLDKLRDRFYFRPDAFPHEVAAGSELFRDLQLGIKLLTNQRMLTRTPAAQLAEKNIATGKQERKLEVYKGNPEPPELNLPRLNRQPFNLDSLNGQVVLVNFWASWCPPCVHEMPSMQRLATQFNNKPFTIVGVNMAETPAEVEKFLNTRVKVDFPIVMDTDGEALKAWGVFAFPTSYVVDKQGKIRYALFGAVEWDKPEIVETLKILINE
ncbi:MAG: TlpA disulfide reductase family protein [Thioalkalispiraceae bacterium]|jgi:thiol-disulfide isomerase/thioredoxin